MAKNVSDCLSILSKVIGQNDGQDPESAPIELIGYISDFYNLIMPQDIKIKENFDFFKFTTVANQDEYTINQPPLPVDQFVNIGSPVWIEDTSTNSTLRMRFYQDPSQFFDRWLLDASSLSVGKPTDILFFDNKITLRTVPDKAYDITMVGYKNNGPLTSTTDDLFKDYIWRYVAYGAAIDWLSDHGQIDQVGNIMPLYERYRDLVLSRTAEQLINTRPLPSF